MKLDFGMPGTLQQDQVMLHFSINVQDALSNMYWWGLRNYGAF
jgi:hypothetical protein